MKNPNWDVDFAASGSVYWAVFWSIRNAVSDSVYWVLGEFMVLDVDRVVEEALHIDSKHPALQDFLRETPSEAAVKNSQTESKQIRANDHARDPE